MNIIIDIRCLLESQYSGVSNYTYNLLLNLLLIDSQNRYFLFYNRYGDHSIIEQNKQLAGLKKFANVKLVGFHWPNKLLNFSLKFFKYPKLDQLIAKKINQTVDLFFLPNPNFVSLSKKCPLVLTIHDLSFERYPQFFADRRHLGLNYLRGRFWHKYVGVKKLCHEANQIIAVSESTKNDLVQLYQLNANKISIVTEGAVIKPIADDQRFIIKEKYKLPEKFILFLGTLEPRKNIESLILAFEKLFLEKKFTDQSLHLVIAGKKGWLYQRLFVLADQSKFSNKIKFINYIAEEDKAGLYKLAQVFVFPSFYEGFGLPVLEAMSCGCSVITSLTSSLPEVAADAALLIDPYNINDLTTAIYAVLTDEQLRIDLIQKGLIQNQKFSWPKAAKESLIIFSQTMSQAKKILIDARMLGTAQRGIGRSIEELVISFIKLDIGAFGGLASNLEAKPPKASYYLFLTKDNFNFNYELDLKLPSNWHKVLVDVRWYSFKEQLVLIKEIRKINPDLVYFPHFNVPLFYFGRFIVTIHDLIWIQHPRQRTEISTLGPVIYGIKNFLSKIIFKSAVKRASKIVVPTKFTKNELINFLPNIEQKIEVIPWGVNELAADKIIVKTADIYEEKCYNITKPYLLYVGSAYPHKNLEFLLRTWAQCDLDWQLVLVGKLDYFYQRLQELAQKLSLLKKVIFTGQVSDDELTQLYRRAQFFVFPSLIEGFGFPPLEAMVNNLPVLSSDIGCLKEILDDAALYFNPTDSQDLKNKILELANNQAKREVLIQKGLLQVKKYSWENSAKKYFDLLTLSLRGANSNERRCNPHEA